MNYMGLAGAGPESLFAGFVEATGMGFQDKRNRNPNWTEHEIVRFLEMLQEDDTVRDLVANRNKKVFCSIAQRMCDEGAGKSWDQCRIKLKNLKSQYRYVKERIPNIDQLDLEDDDVVRQLLQECQGRGISPSSIKHLRFLLRFLNKQRQFSRMAGSGHDSSLLLVGSNSSTNSPSTSGNGTSSATTTPASAPFLKRAQAVYKEEPVSPPSSPFPGLKILPDTVQSATNQKKKTDGEITNGASATGSLSETGYQFLEQFNRDMMDQFMEHQRRTQASFTRWEQERWRQERESMERWRQEAREHERQLFGMFCTAMAKCNAAITAVLKAKTSPAGSGAGVGTSVAAVQNSMPPSVTVSKIQRKSGAVTLKRLAQDSSVEVAPKKARDEEEIDDDEAAIGGEEDEEDGGDLDDEISSMVQVEMEEGDAVE